MEPLPAPSRSGATRDRIVTRRSTPFWAAWSWRSRRTRRRRCSWRRSARGSTRSARLASRGTAKKGWKRLAAGAGADGSDAIEVHVLTRFENWPSAPRRADRPLPRRRVHCRHAARRQHRAALEQTVGRVRRAAVRRVRRVPGPRAPCARRLRRRDGGRKFLLRSDELGLRFLCEPARPPVGLVGGRRHRARRRRGPLPQRRRERGQLALLGLPDARPAVRCTVVRAQRVGGAPRADKVDALGVAATSATAARRRRRSPLRVCPHAAPGARRRRRRPHGGGDGARRHAPRRGRGGGGGAGGGRRPSTTSDRLALRRLFDEAAAQRAVAALAENLTRNFEST